jgi:hypothetical protein
MSKGTNNGRPLEKVVRLIHETLKDKPNTLIHSNYKIENVGGRKREFDIFIETSINDIKVKIAIECKAYKNPVGVEKIEAFKSKCDRVPTINKKVFVSQSGYQADSLNAAREFGIDLYDIKNIGQEEILKWFPISQLGLRFAIKRFNFVIGTNEDDLKKLNTEQFKEFYFALNDRKVDGIQFINDRVLENRDEFWGINVFEFLKKGGSSSIGQTTILPLEMGLHDAYVLTREGIKYPIIGIEADIESWFIERPLEVSNSQTYNLASEIQARRLSIESNEKKEQTDIIITKDKFKVFHTDKDGTTKEFGLIATFDPKTGKFDNEI